jgi:uncharacterized protein (TIGR02646 family)
MKQITKQAEPNSLIEHRAKQHSYFDNLPIETKDELRQNLLSEQGYICCYCMKRIPENTSPYMKVEHFKCQDLHEILQLTYGNLLGACTGNEGQTKIKQTCDTKKGNSLLLIQPISSTPNCETLFKYNSEGEISSVDNNEDINKQLNDVLNLNMQTLKDGRREVYLEVQSKVETESKQYGNKQLKVKYFEREKTIWLNRTNDKFKPFCMVAVYYLTKKIKQYQS